LLSLSALKNNITFSDPITIVADKAHTENRNVPRGDALHAIIARDHKLILITRDNHFKKLEDISKLPTLNARERFVVDAIRGLSPEKLAGIGVFGSVGIDLTPFGGLEKGAYKALIGAKSEFEALSVLTKMGIEESIAKTVVKDVIKSIQRAIDTYKTHILKVEEKKAHGLSP